MRARRCTHRGNRKEGNKTLPIPIASCGHEYVLAFFDIFSRRILCEATATRERRFAMRCRCPCRTAEGNSTSPRRARATGSTRGALLSFGEHVVDKKGRRGVPVLTVVTVSVRSNMQTRATTFCPTTGSTGPAVPRIFPIAAEDFCGELALTPCVESTSSCLS